MKKIFKICSYEIYYKLPPYIWFGIAGLFMLNMQIIHFLNIFIDNDPIAISMLIFAFGGFIKIEEIQEK